MVHLREWLARKEEPLTCLIFSDFVFPISTNQTMGFQIGKLSSSTKGWYFISQVAAHDAYDMCGVWAFFQPVSGLKGSGRDVSPARYGRAETWSKWTQRIPVTYIANILIRWFV